MFKTYLGLFVTGFKQNKIQRYPICMTNADYDYIFDEIERPDNIEFEWNVSVNSDKEWY